MLNFKEKILLNKLNKLLKEYGEESFGKATFHFYEAISTPIKEDNKIISITIEEAYPKLEVDFFGDKFYKNKDGQFHREDGPAKEYADGQKEWYKEGKLHREDGPAVERSYGDKLWYKEGLLHREGGPAIEYANGTNFWFKEGKYHREDGPALEYIGGTKFWYIEGKAYLEEEFNKLIKKEICENPKIDSNGNKYWCKDGEFHREGGPAIEFVDGSKSWCINGKYHRLDGPAKDWINIKEYWVEGKKYTQEQFNKI